MQLKIVANALQVCYNEKMSQINKLIDKLKTKPKDFTFEELANILKYFGYKIDNKGKTSGSRVRFIHELKPPILLHKPHKRKSLLAYQINQILEQLKEEI